ELEPLADALGEGRSPEERADREAADGDDELRPDQLQLPAAPERAQLLLARRRRAVAAPGWRTPRIAARHRGTEERRVELVLAHVEPPAQRLSRAPAPGKPLLALDDAGRLPDHVRALVVQRRAHGERLEWEAGLDARAAAREVALERR